MSLATRRCILVVAIGLIISLSVWGWNEPQANGPDDSNVAPVAVKNDARTEANNSGPVISNPAVQPVPQSIEMPQKNVTNVADREPFLGLQNDQNFIKDDPLPIERPQQVKLTNVIRYETRDGWARYELQGISPAAAENLRRILTENKPSYWQVSFAYLSVGRVYQGKRGFLTISLGAGAPRSSFQKGVYKTSSPIQSGVSLNGTIGGWPFKVRNKTYASYISNGFHYCGADCFKSDSVGEGSPQLGVNLTLTIRTN